MRLGVGRQRAEHRGLVGVDVGERGDRGTAAGGARTTTGRTHAADGTRPGAPRRTRLAAWNPWHATTGPPSSPRVGAPATAAAAGCAGPGVLPAHAGRRPRCRPPRERFDDLALGIVTEHRRAVAATGSGLVEYAVEDAPQMPDDWSTETVPLSSLVRGTGATPDPAGRSSAARSSTARETAPTCARWCSPWWSSRWPSCSGCPPRWSTRGSATTERAVSTGPVSTGPVSTGRPHVRHVAAQHELGHRLHRAGRPARDQRGPDRLAVGRQLHVARGARHRDPLAQPGAQGDPDRLEARAAGRRARSPGPR